jgi:hypothetical protein
MPRNVLIYLDTGPHPSTQLRIQAIDAGLDEVLAYGSVRPAEVRELVHGVLFSRKADELRASAIAIGGADVLTAEEILVATDAAFLGPLRVSVLLDPRGANTIAAATVVRLVQDSSVRDRRVLILGATGPIGIRIAGLLAYAGAEVLIGSRRRDHARDAASRIRARLGVDVGAVEVRDGRSAAKALAGVPLLVNTAAAGATVLRREVWANAPDLEAVMDVNATPPQGIEGVSAADDGNQRDGKRVYGALTIARLRTDVQRRCLTRLFERNDLVLDAEEIYDLARSVAVLGPEPQPVEGGQT